MSPTLADKLETLGVVGVLAVPFAAVLFTLVGMFVAC